MSSRPSSDLLAAAPFPRLAGLAAGGRLSPSLLLAGPSGAPTAEAAIALAAIVNSPDGEPDSKATRELEERIRCTEELARSTAGRDPGGGWPGPGAGPYPDVRIVRPESGKPIRVEEIRTAVAATRSRPFEGRRRFLIIVEADAMNPPAANALLKTLEEPHDRLGVIVCAIQEAALLSTIVSRCQRWRFRAPTAPEVAAWLQEHHGYSEEEAAAAAAAARGDRNRALALARDRLLPLAEEAERIAAVVGRGIPAPARAALTERLAKASPRSRKAGGPPEELRTLLVLVRAVLRDLAALHSGAKPLTGGRSGRLRQLAALAPGRAFAEAALLVEDADRKMHHFHGNKRMQLDALLLGFNEIARPLVLARMRNELQQKRAAGTG